MQPAAPPGAGTLEAAWRSARGPSAYAQGLFERVAIVVPFYNAAASLGEVFAALTPCAELGAELHAVDDGSEDRSVEIALQFPAVRLHRHGKCNGCGQARNTAALATTREFLVFIDSDVVAAREDIHRLVQLVASGSCDAAVGCYGELHDHEGLLSQYKNLWIRRTYLRAPRELDWLWCAFCAMRRDHFLAAGGFNEEYREIDGGEDFELGWRMRAHGSRLRLDPSITCRHLKRFSLRSLLANDFRRARGYSTQALTFRGDSPVRVNRFANIRLGHFVSGLLAVALPLAPLAALLAGRGLADAGALAAALAALWILAQLRFLAYFASCRGIPAAVLSLPVLYLDQLASLAGAFTGAAAWALGARSPGGPGIR